MTLSPLVRISFGLIMLMISVMLFAQLFGIVPNTREAELETRKIIAESLAVQVSAAVANDNPEATLTTMKAVVSRNDSVLSVGVRTVDGELMTQAGNHQTLWKSNFDSKSTATDVIVPLFKGDERWGNIEVKFGRLNGKGKRFYQNSFFSLLLFLGVSGFIVYYAFLRRALRELNPDAVIPERVRTALNTLAEGVLIVDSREQIVFANATFSSKVEIDTHDLMGKAAEELGWDIQDKHEMPWVPLLRGDTPPGPIDLALVTPSGKRLNLIVNASPISGGPNQPVRGVMATFDDVTELEKANDELRHALLRLESNEKEIKRQNKELQELATRDPLTGCLNRRSFFKGFETLMEDAMQTGSAFSCIMVDIDHFKGINDTYGHSTGDTVIKLVAELLQDNASPDDLIGRYGGEEFCLVMPECTAQVAAEHAEKLRSALLERKCTPLESMPVVTASFGVSELDVTVKDSAILVDHADEALYRAKNEGRNRVAIYDVNYVRPASENNTVADAHTDVDTDSKSDSDSDIVVLGAKKTMAPIPMDDDDTHTMAGINPDLVSTLEIRVHELEDVLALRTGDGVLERVTDIPGRQILIDRTIQAIERAKRYRHLVVAMALRLDALPRVRDALGEMAAEKFREIAVDIIRQTLRASDSVGVFAGTNARHSVARLGSERIALLLTDIESIEQVPQIVKRLQSALAVPQEIAGNEISLTSDFGISIYPQDSLDAITLLRHANAAMNAAARDTSHERTRYYAAEIDAMSKRILSLETDLYRAIDNKEFDVYFQPKIAMGSGQIVGMEALLRWNNPRLGFVPPDEFIPIAERVGCMESISQQTLERVCRQIRMWQSAGLGAIPVAINLSPVEFHNPNLAKNILKTIESFELDPSLLEFEITESMVIENAESATDIMHELSSAGSNIAIDDFGTGYATLQCLTQFPVSTIKIDRSFMNGLLVNAQDAAVVNGVTSLAHTMGLRVVAEGVEEPEQIAYLSDLQCDELQGYYFSRPLPSDEATTLLAHPSRIVDLLEVATAGTAVRSGHVGARFLGLLNDTNLLKAQ